MFEIGWPGLGGYLRPMLIRPRHLSPGDTLGIIAPASAPPDSRAIDRSVGVLEALGFKVKLAPNVRQRHGYLAGSDRERAAAVEAFDLHAGASTSSCAVVPLPAPDRPPAYLDSARHAESRRPAARSARK